MMNIELIHHTPLWVASRAIRKCWASEDKSDTCNTEDRIGEKDRELIHRVGNKNKHKSTLEHLVYTFDVDGISRACLQELARHRMASYSVKSTRYTLKELRDTDDYNFSKFLVPLGDTILDGKNAMALSIVKQLLDDGKSNDVVKYFLPEAYKTSLVWTINARSLQNFLELRSSKAALWEIREMAQNVFNVLPEEHKYLFEEYMYEDTNINTTN